MDEAMTTPSREAHAAAAAFVRSDDCPVGMKMLFSGKPFFALQEAFQRFQLEERERCQALMEREEAGE